MGLFDDGIDYDKYEKSVIEDNKQINNDIVITDKTNFNYTFDSDTPIETIINQLPGYKTKVTYFNKTTGNQEVYEYPDLTLDDIIVEYSKIENLTLFMDNPVDVNDLENYEGEGYIRAGIEPLPGDFLLMSLYDKRLGLFVVSKTEATTYNFTRIFKISFKFYMFPDEEALHKINNNVNKELVADDTLNNTGNEILYDYDRYTALKRISELINKYIKIWYNRIIRIDNNYTISYYSKDLGLYVGDPYMERFIINMFGLTDLKNVSLFNKLDNELSILDIIIDKDVSKWNINKKYEEKYMFDVLNYPLMKNFTYNQIDYFVSLNNDENNKYYILSENFYKNYFNDEKTEITDNLEIGVLALLTGIDIDIKTFNSMLDDLDNYIKQEDDKGIFYRIPLTIAVMKYFKYIHNYPDKFLY